jgi:uncharacterized protein (DUF1330 family)
MQAVLPPQIPSTQDKVARSFRKIDGIKRWYAGPVLTTPASVPAQRSEIQCSRKNLWGALAMTTYLFGQIRINDPELYKRYTSNFLSVLAKYEGELLAVDDAPEALEGKASGERIVILRFADRAAAQRWWQSPEYREIVKHRHARADSQVFMLSGFVPSPATA